MTSYEKLTEDLPPIYNPNLSQKKPRDVRVSISGAWNPNTVMSGVHTDVEQLIGKSEKHGEPDDLDLRSEQPRVLVSRLRDPQHARCRRVTLAVLVVLMVAFAAASLSLILVNWGDRRLGESSSSSSEESSSYSSEYRPLAQANHAAVKGAVDTSRSSSEEGFDWPSTWWKQGQRDPPRANNHFYDDWDEDYDQWSDDDDSSSYPWYRDTYDWDSDDDSSDWSADDSSDWPADDSSDWPADDSSDWAADDSSDWPADDSSDWPVGDWFSRERDDDSFEWPVDDLYDWIDDASYSSEEDDYSYSSDEDDDSYAYEFGLDSREWREYQNWLNTLKTQWPNDDHEYDDFESW